MKHLIVLAALCAWPSYCHTKVRGDVAKALYELIPQKAQDARNIFPGFYLKTVKAAGDVRCHIRDDDSFICVLPDKNPDDNIYLNQETSEMFYEVLKPTGLSKELGTHGSLICTAPNPAALEHSSPSCHITLQ